MSGAGGARTAYVLLAPGTPSERKVLIHGRLYVGRECQGIDEQHRLLINDGRVSRLHAEITMADDGSAWITDRSANGTTLNGAYLPIDGPVQLEPGDRIGLGTPVLEYGTPPGYLEPPPNGRPFFVEIREPDRPIRLRVIEGPLEIGRDCPGELVHDMLVSRSHLKFVPRPGFLTVADLGGRNGTLINGIRLIEPVNVRPGDVIRIGRTELVLLAPQERARTAASEQTAPPEPVYQPSAAPAPSAPVDARAAAPIRPEHVAPIPQPELVPAVAPHPSVAVSGSTKFFALLAALFVLGVALLGMSVQPKLAELQSNDPNTALPAAAESTTLGESQGKFIKIDNFSGFVVFYRAGGLTATDQDNIVKAREVIVDVKGIDKTSALLSPVEFSKDQTAAAISAPLIFKDKGVDIAAEDLSETQKAVANAAKAAATDGLEVHTAGPAALSVAAGDAFSELDAPLLITTIVVVVLILLVVYRSPTLLFVPLLCAALAIGLSSLVVYLLADNDLVTLTGIAQAILSVLVLGAGTDYALLLIARYREELYKHENRFEAMFTAWKESAEAIVASAGTASAGLLCLAASDLKSNKGLGPVAAAGIGATLVVMMTVLPVLLAVLGRWIFWPNIPKPAKIDDLGKGGLWGKISDVVVRHRRMGWIVSTLVLLVGLLGMSSLDTSGLTIQEQLKQNPDAVVGSKLYDEKFPESQGSGAPALILTNTLSADAVIDAVSKVDGVAQAPGSVCILPDLDKLAAAQQQQQGGQQSGEAACVPPEVQVQPVDGRTMIYANLTASQDDPRALSTIERMRTAAHAVPGADAVVGGRAAELLDIHDGTVSDRNLIIPLVLVVIFFILILLLRAIAAPILLIGTVVLSFAATLGVSGFVFEHVFGFAAADQNFPLFAFVFLVALGVDYNIFLMTRVRQEAKLIGTRSGIRRALTVTGGVITSAGMVLAATFAVLITTPLVVLAEVGFAVAFGVLLDTLIVRTILVPALAHEIGRSIWWPSKLRKGLD